MCILLVSIPLGGFHPSRYSLVSQGVSVLYVGLDFFGLDVIAYRPFEEVPSSLKFLKCCSRRCFLHFSLNLIHDATTNASWYLEQFNELTAPLDRLVFCVVLQCFRALSRCSVVLIEIDSIPILQYFPSKDDR